jgi:type IV secretion system protein VirD4
MKDPHWDDSARDLIKGIILYIKLEMPFPDQHTLVTLRETLTDPVKLDRALVSMANSAALGGVIASAATTFAIKPDKERDSVLSTALRHTEFLDSPGMRRVLCGSKNLKPLASLKSLRASHRDPTAKAVTIYLCLPAGRMPTHARWLRVIINFALAQMELDAQRDDPAAKPQGPSVLFLLDEFATLGHMPQLSVAAGLMAGFGVRLWPFLQDLSQLQHHYERSWETFVGNAGAHTFFGNTDLTTLRHVSERLGKVRMISAGRSHTNGAAPGSHSETTSLTETTSPLLSTDEIQILFARRKDADDYLILLLPHSLPIAVRKIAYFRNKELIELLDPPPPSDTPPKKASWGLRW